MGYRQLRTSGWALLLMAAVVVPAAGQTSSRATQEARREQWQRVGDVFEMMGVKPGAVVADVGAGDGFFTARLSKAVGPEGRVFAVDVSASALRNLRARVADEALTNVDVIEGEVDDPRLPSASLDAILIVNAYHEMTAHAAMMSRMKAALKPGGRLVILEPITPSRRDSPRDQQTRNHEIAVEYVQADAREAGFMQVSMQGQFFTRPQAHGEYWALVLTPASAETRAQGPWSDSKEADWMAADLRISRDEFKRLLASGDVLVLDVRDDAMFRAGHLPGAVLMTVEEITSADGIARLKSERRPIVAYCSCESEQTSARVALVLRNAGVEGVKALVGGYEQWVRRGEVVEKGK